MADEVSEFGGEMDSVTGGDPACEVDVPLSAFRVCYIGCFGEVEEDSDSFTGYPACVIGHSVAPLWFWGSGRVYKSWVDNVQGKRGRAARLARGAHNPKVGSSNLPPATKYP